VTVPPGVDAEHGELSWIKVHCPTVGIFVDGIDRSTRWHEHAICARNTSVVAASIGGKARHERLVFGEQEDPCTGARGLDPLRLDIDRYSLSARTVRARSAMRWGMWLGKFAATAQPLIRLSDRRESAWRGRGGTVS